MKRLLTLQLLFVAYTIIVICIVRCSVPDSKIQLPPVVSLSIADTVYIPQPQPVEIIHIQVPANIDTAAILQQYYTQNIYSRPIIDTELLKVNLTDTVYNNILLSSTATYTMRIPQYRHDISIGALAGFNTLSLLATYRYDRLGMSAGYDFINKGIVFGVNYRLFRW